MDYKSIIKNLEVDKIEKLLYQLGAQQVIRKEDCLITNTICHNVRDGSLKLYYYFDNKFFYCYSGGCGGMSIFKFLEEYYKTRQIDYDWYQDVYCVARDCSASNVNGLGKVDYVSLKDRYRKKVTPVLGEYNEGVLNVFMKYYPVEWLDDGITKAAMDKYNILYSPSQNKIIIPHYSIDNRLVGIRGRALNEWEVENVGKYMPVQIEGKWYKHPLSLNLYGLNMNKENIRKNGYVFLYESEKSILQAESFEQPNCAVAVCGSNFNKYQLKILIKECSPKEIIICFDKEEKKGEDKYFYKLWNMGQKYKNYCNISFIYDNKGLLNLKESPSDRGEKVFNELLKGRVKIK